MKECIWERTAIFILFRRAITIAIVVSTLFWGAISVRAETQTISGDPVEITVYDTGKMAPYYDNWEDRYQYYNEYASNNVLWLNAGDEGYDVADASTADCSSCTDFTPVSNSKPDAWTIETVYDAGTTGIRIFQTVTYADGAKYYNMEWIIENTGSTTYNDLYFMRGGDTYFGGDDSSNGHYDASLDMVYLTNEGVTGIMGLLGTATSPIDHYYEANYSDVQDALNSGNHLPDTVKSDYHDAGYAVEWDRATLAPGETWEIKAIEKWTESGDVQVMAPAGQSGNVGDTFTYDFTVQNLQSSSDTFDLSLSSSQSWDVSLPDGNTVTIDAGSSATVQVQVTATSAGSDQTTLTATSQSDSSVTNDDSVTTEANALPTANANGPYSANAGETITLDGTGSSDSDGSIVSYDWDLDDDGSYDDATGSQPTHSWSTGGTYTVGLKVTDDDGASDTDTATVDVNGLPTATDDTYSTDEDTALNVSAAGVLENDNDPDDDPLTVSEVEGNSGNVGSQTTLSSDALVTLDPDGSFTYDPNDQFEALAAGESETDSFTYTVSDGNGGTDSATVTVTIDGVNDAPTDIDMSNSTVTENDPVDTVVGTLSTTDVDTNDTYTYTLQNTGDCEGLGPDNGSFAIDGSALKTAETFDFETKSAYTICIRTEDSGGSTYSKQFVIDIINEPCDLGLAKEVSDSTPAEDWTVLYTVTLTNNGPDHAKDVVVSDTEPISLTFDSASVTQGSYDINTGIWNVGYLTESLSATLLITTEVEPAMHLDQITNTAVISSFDQADADPSNDQADAPIQVHDAEFEVTKTVDDCTSHEGTNFTYTITLTNHGYTSTAVISDVLPAELTYVSDIPSQGIYDETTGIWDAGMLGIDDVETLEITTYPITGTAHTTLTSTAVLTNTVILTDSSRLDWKPDNNADNVTVNVQKDDAVESPEITPATGGVLTYTTDYTDTQPLTTTVEVPANAVTSSVTLIYTPMMTPTHDAPGGLQFADHLFDLTAYRCPDCTFLPSYEFSKPITVTIHYTDTQVEGLYENTLVLHYWDGEAWVDAACGEYERHPEQNWLAVPICHLTNFALLGQSVPVGGMSVPTNPLRALLPWAALAALAALLMAGGAVAYAGKP